MKMRQPTDEEIKRVNEAATDREFTEAVLAEVKRARAKFPGANATNAALVEEVGEVSTALMFEPWNMVRAECVQVAAMALRLAIEGDATFKDWREKKIHENGARYDLPEHRMPNGQ